MCKKFSLLLLVLIVVSFQHYKPVRCDMRNTLRNMLTSSARGEEEKNSASLIDVIDHKEKKSSSQRLDSLICLHICNECFLNNNNELVVDFFHL